VFLQQDEALRFMWNDLAELVRLACVQSKKNDNDPGAISYRREKLRGDRKPAITFSPTSISFSQLFRSFLTT